MFSQSRPGMFHNCKLDEPSHTRFSPYSVVISANTVYSYSTLASATYLLLICGKNLALTVAQKFEEKSVIMRL